MIDILLAVYNGSAFLREQIESILNQSEQSWRLYICDDCSKDDSFAISSEYAEKYPERITAYRNEKPTGSARLNFMGMLKRAEAEYVMFCDQDDFWKRDKIKLTLEKMKDMEKKYPDSPLLVHSELEIVDSELRVIRSSFTSYQGLKPEKSGLNSLICQNNVTGCTLMMNRRLTELMKAAPADYVLMHDWWAAIAAAAFGHIGFIEQPLIEYRQHGSNQVGAVNNRQLGKIRQIINKKEETKERLNATYLQAERFLECYEEALSHESAETLRKYIDIPKHNKAVRMALLLKNGFLKQNFLSAVGQLIFC